MKRWIASALPVVGFLLLVVVLEAAHLWPQRNAFRELQPVAVVYGASVLLASAIGLGLLVGSVGRGLTLVGVAWTCICGASIVKRRYLGSPLYPWDLFRVREVVGIWGNLPSTLRAAFVAGTLAFAAALAACVISVFRARAEPGSGIRKATAGAAILAVVLLPFHPAVRSWWPGPGNALSVALRLRNVRWWPDKNYQVNGFTAGFLMSLDILQIPQPPEAPWALGDDCDPTSSSAAAPADARAVRPDVIVLLLESFFDPLVLGIPFGRDPIPFLRTMMQASGHAEVHSTVWAHGTANAEFEILTGLSTAFLPPDSVVFFHYLHAPLLSLATEFRRVGYRAEAVHSNAGWFYARADAYRWLGFERAWFQEDFVAPREARARISDDRVLFAKLRERLTPRGADGARPEFLWGVTLGTHGPYARNRSPGCDLRVGDGAAANGRAAGVRSSERFEPLWVYACLLERLDRHMQDFVRWLELRGKPYVLFAYGDHWPPLGPGLDAYRERFDARGRRLSAATSNGDETPRFSATPLVVASNTDVALPYGYGGGFNFLGPTILRAAGLAPRCQFELLEPLHARVDVIHPGLMGPGIEPDLAAAVKRYWSLTYQLLIRPPWRRRVRAAAAP
jgi:Sulfatase